MKCVPVGLIFVTLALCQTDPLITVKPGPQVIKDKDLWGKDRDYPPLPSHAGIHR